MTGSSVLGLSQAGLIDIWLFSGSGVLGVRA
jgi:hypothetical protein